MPRARSHDREQRILEFIRKSTEERGYPPSIREICQAAGLKSTSTVHSYLLRLEQANLIRRDGAKSRTIELVEKRPQFVRLPLLGKVAAGRPILAEEFREGEIALPQDLVGPGAHFLLRVRGDSMIGRGINDGDLVIVRQASSAERGTLVVALIGDEATVKTLERDGQAWILRAANPAYADLRPAELGIVGRVVGLLRLYGGGAAFPQH
ncbi:MAG: transcriptional repressor LexA [Thermaerobacter sp.]|nr:transcriptional repressor LexA [Thermaerobacter sp.]